MSDGNSHFLMAIGRIDGGHAIEVADEQLRDVISAVTRTGKKGTVTVTLEISPNGETGFLCLRAIGLEEVPLQTY